MAPQLTQSLDESIACRNPPNCPCQCQRMQLGHLTKAWRTWHPRLLIFETYKTRRRKCLHRHRKQPALCNATSESEEKQILVGETELLAVIALIEWMSCDSWRQNHSVYQQRYFVVCVVLDQACLRATSPPPSLKLTLTQPLHKP